MSTLLGWIVAIYLVINALIVIGKVGQRKANLYYTGADAVLMVLITALIITALAIA